MRQTQNLFRAALMDPSQPAPDGLTDGAARPAGRRFDVYRNNVAVSLTEAIRTGFPVITKLLGRENIDGLAGIFLRAHPPTSPVIITYGQTFPDFLAGTDQLRHLGYLADVARLELAIRRSYHAADAQPVAQDAFGAIPPDALMGTTMGLAPALQIVRSDWPIHAIWRFNTEDGAPKPTPVAQDVLITRPEFDPVLHLLSPGGAAWITALSKGQTIGAALEAALAETPDFDLAAPLALLLQGRAVISLTPKG